MSVYVDAWGEEIVADAGFKYMRRRGPDGLIGHYLEKDTGKSREIVTLAGPPRHGSRSATRCPRRTYDAAFIAEVTRPADVLLRMDRESPIRLELTDAARSTIVSEAMEWASRETGGWMFGGRRGLTRHLDTPSDAGVVEITHAAHAGPSVSRGARTRSSSTLSTRWTSSEHERT